MHSSAFGSAGHASATTLADLVIGSNCFCLRWLELAAPKASERMTITPGSGHSPPSAPGRM